jgi:hypothetical protein
MSVHPNRRQARPAPLEQPQRVGSLCRKHSSQPELIRSGCRGELPLTQVGPAKRAAARRALRLKAALGELDIISRHTRFPLGWLRDMWSSPSCRIAGGSLEGMRGGILGGGRKEKRQEP